MAPRIAKGKVIIGASGGDRHDARLLRRLRRHDRTPRVALLHRAGRSGEGLRERGDEEGRGHVGRGSGVVDQGRRRRGVGRHRLRPRSRAGLRGHRQRRAVDVPSPLGEGQGQPVRLLDRRRGRRHRRAEVALPGGARRQLGLRQRAAADPGHPAHQRPRSQGDHAGQQERLLLRDRSDHRPVHLGAAVRLRHVGQGHRPEDRPPDGQPRSVLRHRRRSASLPAAAARTTGRRCRSTR